MTKSLWQKIDIDESRSLHGSKNCEICIVGAGISGLTAAYRLTSLGMKVVVIHAGDLRAGETSKSTAQINTVHDDGWADMLELHGEEHLRLCYQSYVHAAVFIEKLITEKSLDCGYEKISGYLFTEREQEGQQWVDAEYEAALKAGVTGLSKVKATPLPEYQKGPALLYEDQAQLQPLSYLSELRRLLLQSGLCEIYGHAGVKEIEEGETHVTLFLDDGKEITASKVILATNVPIHRKLIPIEALAAYRSYVVAFRVKKNSIPRYQYWDNEDPYHFVRLEGEASNIDHPAGDSEILLVGGEDHRVGDVVDIEDHYKTLTEWGRKHFPVIDVTGLRWSAQTIETFDGMPLIGACDSNRGRVFIITGDSGTGITHGTIGGLLLADKLVNKSLPWEKLYNPSRSRTKSLKRWAGENIKNLVSYTDWLTPGEVLTADEIELESGAIIREGASKLAVYRDSSGSLTKLSAVCPHLGALVRWNAVEKSWDCPAHGSRFSPTGQVLNGPAACSLACLNPK